MNNQLERIFSEIDKESKAQIEQIQAKALKEINLKEAKSEFICKTIFNNKKLLKHIKEKNISTEDINYNFDLIIRDNYMMNLERRNGKEFTIQDAQDSFFIKSGYYKMDLPKELTPETPIKNLKLRFTQKGEEFYKAYLKLLNK